MIAPDELAHRMYGLLVESGALDMARDGASLCRVEPAVRAPTEAVGDRVRVFQAKALEMHDRVAIGNIVVIGVGIKQEVRRIEDPHSAASPRAGCGDIEPLDKRLVLVE